jgi:polyketide biosynthesis 3-hydroxy-3-methylglutaryl-CoA synthase-like enzyme PksG
MGALKMKVGIEAINAYAGQTFLDVNKLAQHRGLDNDRFVNLLMKNKSVAMHFEDPVSFGVNAAKPIIDALTPEEKNKIELLIVSSESGIDFGKGMNSYIHHYLGLKKNCRMFEAKMACYGGTACLQMAINFVASNVSPGAKALVISTDAARPLPNSYAEPSQGAAGLAVLVSDNPKVLKMDFGANGYWGYEVMDTCRPTPDIETGDPDLSLLSYLDCIENAFKCYQDRVPGADFQSSFDYLAFHTPFGGMVKGAHRTMMRKLKRLPPPEIEADFQKRMLPALKYCQEVGNVYSATVFLAVCGLIDAADFSTGDKKIGLFSYGSGCCSEFYSGVANAQSLSFFLASSALSTPSL